MIFSYQIYSRKESGYDDNDFQRSIADGASEEVGFTGWCNEEWRH